MLRGHALTKSTGHSMFRELVQSALGASYLELRNNRTASAGGCKRVPEPG